MASYESIIIDSPQLTRQEDAADPSVWLTDVGDPVALYFFNQRTDIQAAIDDEAALRAYYDKLTRGPEIALVELETCQIEGMPAIKSIVKHRQKPTGMVYVGSYTLPLRDFSFTIKVQCIEGDLTGMREAILLDRAVNEGQIEFSESGEIVSWAGAPIPQDDELHRMPTDDVAYDEEFPDHPLSRARNTLELLQTAIKIGGDLHDAAPFVYPLEAKDTPWSRPRTKKPWWKFWN